MFTVDETPAHVVATPAAQAHLRTLAEARGDITVLLTEQGAAVLKAGQQPPAGTVLPGSARRCRGHHLRRRRLGHPRLVAHARRTWTSPRGSR